MKWTIEYFEQQDTTQPAEVFEDMLVVTHPKLRGKLLQITDTLEFYGHQMGGGYIEKCHDYQECGRFVSYTAERLLASSSDLIMSVS